MENCYSASTVSGTESVGGVCGNNFNGKLLNCYNTGAVIGTGWYIGGVCGIVNNGGTIQNCYSTGTVGGSSSSSVVGGVCGMNNRSGTISNCYFDSEKCDKDAIGTNNGTVTNVEGKTTEQFKSGEVCYLLNGSVSDGSQKWYQTIGTDGAPVLDNTRGTVYYATLLCGGEKNVGNTYANTQEVSIEHDYNENGFCTKCGAYQPATDSDSDGVYEIGNAGQLFWFAALVNGDNTHADFDAQNTSASAVLTNDIDLENREWKPITAFAGSFDGQGHTVSNFKITSTTNNSGFFGSANGTIMNFTLKGEITLSADGAEIGSIVGNTDGATIRNIASYVNISNTAVELKHVGGVVGSIQTTETVVDQCVYYGNMNIQNSHDCIGGVVGYTSDGGRISNCANLGTVTATKDGAYVGGVLGYVNNTKAMVKNCYNYGSVSNGSTSTYCGAVIGWVRSHTAGNLADNYYLDASCSLGFGSASNSGATATAKTAEQFASGKVCYLLNGNTSDGAWGQTIGTDPYPVLGGDKVYYGYADCDENKDQTYSNTELADTRPDHNYSNGFCTKCGAYQPATLTTDKYDIDGVEGFDEVYEIGNAGQLYWFAALVNGTDGLTQNLGANAVLTADITVNTGVLNADGTLASDVSGFTEWTPIVGNDYPDYYAGTFDGQNHTVSGLYFDNSSVMRIGLFGHLGSSGKISNVGVVDSYFKGKDYVGGVCGAKYGAVENCYSASTVSGTECIGGVCGNNYSGILLNCYNTGAVIGTGWYIGGVCGILNSGKIENCYSTGTVSGSSEPVGGVCGYNGYSTISNCYFDSSKCDKNAVGLNNNGTVEKTEGKTTTQFASGEVAYLLQSGQTADENGVTPEVWGQTIGTEDYPVLGGEKVYLTTGECVYYTNTFFEGEQSHDYVNGFCTKCGAYQPATLTTDKYDINGDGQNDAVYEIGNAGQLYWFAALVNGDKRVIKEAGENASKNAVLTKDITVNSGVLKEDGSLSDNSSSFTSWTPIGYFNSYEDKCPYTGTFDGQNHKISGLYFNSSKNSVGLFGYVENGTVKNVGVEDSYFNVVSSNGEVYVGGVCGYNISGTITNCYNTGKVSVSSTSAIYAGGVCGWNGGAITNCYNTGKVTSTSDAYAGGVCGVNGGEIKSCYNTGEVTDTATSYAYAGGVCGCNVGEITNCYNEGLVNASGNTVYAGGVCGDNDIQSGSGTPTIANCYSTGSVTANVTDTTGTSNSGTAYAGGVCGSNGDEATIANCYFDSTVYNGEAVGNNNGGTVSANVIGKTTEQFNSGEVAYLLSQGCTVDDILFGGSVWGQTLSGTDKQDYPVLGGLPVYFRDEVYTNTYGILTVGTQTITASNEPPIWYEFTPTSDGNYRFSSKTINGGVCVNTKITINDMQGMSSSPIYALSTDTTYYVYLNCSQGEYDLTIEKLNTTLTTGDNELIVPTTGRLWYEFTPTETGSYQFSSTQLTAGNLYVNTTQNESDYTDIATSPTYNLEAETTYYVAVSATPGNYDLTITLIPTALETVTAPQIYAVDGRIVCEGEYSIYDLLGRDVTLLNGSLYGVYVVKTTDAAQKVIVK
ncbi:MAG: GLUG motif-containing protein [Paludibacteraceae bacterium]|nr:GLUG motif-containing protein [Paludibacteraceae bacterium]